MICYDSSTPITTRMASTKKSSRPGVFLPPLQRNSSIKNTSSSKPPPTPVCVSLNNQIRSNPMYTYPDFDFASYVKHRKYSFSTFDFGRSIAAAFLDNDVCNMLAGQSLSRAPSSTPSVSSSFETRDARDKGSGMFATSFIPYGSTIFDEHPTIIAPYLLGISVPPAEMLTELFETLPKRAFAFATSLATSHQDDVAPKSTLSPSLPLPSFYEDIMQTNSVAIHLTVPTNTPYPEMSIHRGLFLLLSRCNHSCNPNATWSWDKSSLTLTLTALRPISPTEEITISYIPLSGDHVTDRMALKESYGFDCTCEECTLPSYTAANNKSATYTVPGTDVENLPTFEEWLTDPTLPDNLLINAHKHALCLIEKQKHASSHPNTSDYLTRSTSFSSAEREIDHHVEIISMCYGALGDVSKFRKWTAITKEAILHPEQQNVLNRWLSNPTSFPLWGRRPPSGYNLSQMHSPAWTNALPI